LDLRKGESLGPGQIICKNTEFQHIHKVMLVYLNPGYSNNDLHVVHNLPFIALN